MEGVITPTPSCRDKRNTRDLWLSGNQKWTGASWIQRIYPAGARSFIQSHNSNTGASIPTSGDDNNGTFIKFSLQQNVQIYMSNNENHCCEIWVFIVHRWLCERASGFQTYNSLISVQIAVLSVGISTGKVSRHCILIWMAVLVSVGRKLRNT